MIADFDKLKSGVGLRITHEVLGGTWIWANKAPGRTQTKWIEGDVGLYFVDQEHPITKGASNFDWKDEVYNQMEMSPDVHVLAQSFVDVFNIWPQLWTYEKTWDGGSAPYRAFVSIPGHEYTSFEAPQYRIGSVALPEMWVIGQLG